MKKAATVILLRDAIDGIEVLLLQRSNALQVLGGYWVFPGGKLDDTDQGDCLQDRLVQAALREVKEETGIELLSDSLIPVSRWQTPEGIPKRFDTYFYVALCNDDQVTIDNSEIIGYQWLSCSRALRSHQQGLAPMMPPTVVSLMKVNQFDKVTEALTGFLSRPNEFYSPKIQQHEGKTLMIYNHDERYNDQSIQGSIDRCLWIDNHWEYHSNK